jgi:hypothetical protein
MQPVCLHFLHIRNEEEEGHMDEWHDFFLAQAGAAGVLTGLVFVAVSINLQEILSEPGSGLPGRAAEALILLVGVLTASILLLVPGQSKRAVGVEVLAVGLAAWRWVRSPRYRWWSRASPCWQYGWEVSTGWWRA